MRLNNLTEPLKKNKCLALFLGILTINIAQSLFTPLLNDEPYYWLYAQYPSWGYFDHPPMIALLIRMGTALFGGEIGVRIFTAIPGSLTFCLIYSIIEGESGKPVSFRLAALLLLSSVFLNLYSFLAIPDTPMLFFAALFLYSYRRYLYNSSALNSIVLGVVTALLLYSKYHGILLVGFTIVSNPRLVLKKGVFIAFTIALLLYLPHIWWEYQHDYPTIRFQFFERANVFRIGHVLSYIGEQAAVTGPVILLLFSLLYKPLNQFQKSLKFIVAGVFLFFLASSFKETVNMHWTAIAWPAMVCLAYLHISARNRTRKAVTGLLVFNLAAVVVFRLNFIGNFFQLSNFNDRNPAQMAMLIKERSKNYPVVFSDMYIEPSDLSFYSHKACFAVNDIGYKKTQFNYLPDLERSFQGETVCYVSSGPVNSSSQKLAVQKGRQYFTTVIPNFTSYNTGVKINAPKMGDLKASAKSSVSFSIDGELTGHERQLFKAKGGSILFTLTNLADYKSYGYKYNEPLDLSDKRPLTFNFSAPAKKGSYKCVFSVITNDGLPPGFNSNIYSVTVNAH